MRKLILIGFIASLACAACSDDNTSTDTGTGNPDGGTRADSGMMSTCDPNAGPAHVRLLNATLDQGVETVQKTPQHPGEPGPDGLP